MSQSPQDDGTNPKLTPKQKAFINAYMVNGFNATRAALTAGYSELTAYASGAENLRKPLIKLEIQRMMKEHLMPAEEVLSRLTEHARGDLGDIYNEATGQIDWERVRSEGKSALIKKIDHKTARTTTTNADGTETEIEVFEDKIELHSVQTALQMIGKYYGQFTERIDIHITWQDEAVSLIKAGQITYQAALETFDNDDTLVRDLFAKAQVPISID